MFRHFTWEKKIPWRVRMTYWYILQDSIIKTDRLLHKGWIFRWGALQGRQNSRLEVCQYKNFVRKIWSSKQNYQYNAKQIGHTYVFFFEGAFSRLTHNKCSHRPHISQHNHPVFSPVRSVQDGMSQIVLLLGWLILPSPTIHSGRRTSCRWHDCRFVWDQLP